MMSKLPLNRIVAFIGPYVAILSGAVVDWLFVHLHFLSNFHTNQSAITSWLTQAMVFAITSVIVWLGQQKWLQGWIAFESKVVQETGLTLSQPEQPPQLEESKTTK